MAHPFEVRKELELDATPEEVWDAIATGPGIDSWFMGTNEVEPRVGGRVRMTMPGGNGTVPPARGRARAARLQLVP